MAGSAAGAVAGAAAALCLVVVLAVAAPFAAADDVLAPAFAFLDGATCSMTFVAFGVGLLVQCHTLALSTAQA